MTPIDLDRVINEKMYFERQAWGQRLLACRRKRLMSQAELASRAGVTQQTISKIERAQVDASTEVKFKICYILGVQIGHIFKEPAIFTHTDDPLVDNDHVARWRIGHVCAECDGPVVMAGLS